MEIDEITKEKIERADPSELREIIKNLDLENPLYTLVLDKLTKLASIDQLTGVYNRNMWVGEFLRELKYTDENSKYLGCILMDIDDFGQANKKYGHDFGDLLLNKLGVCIKKRLRSLSKERVDERREGIIRGDIFGRYGGEEFIIFAPQGFDNEKQAILGMEKLGEKVQLIGEAVTTSAVISSTCPYLDNYITLSLGCALYKGTPKKSINYYCDECDRAKIAEHPLIKKADEALSKAKINGKNKSICLEQIV